MARESVILTAARLDSVKWMVVARRARVALFIGPTANASGENEKPDTFGRSVWDLADAELGRRAHEEQRDEDEGRPKTGKAVTAFRPIGHWALLVIPP